MMSADLSPAIAFVESNTTGNGLRALQAAHQAGYQVHLLVRDLAFYKVKAPAFASLIEHCHQIHQVDTNDVNVVESCLRAIEGLQGVTTFGEYYLGIVAAVCRRLKLPGMDPAAVERARDKSKTRTALTERGLPQPAFRVVDTPEALLTALDAITLPCILKPLDRSSSTNVKLVTDRQEALSHFEAIRSSKVNSRGQLMASAVLVEQYVSGEEVSVETLTVAGKTHFIGITTKGLTGAPHFVEAQHIFPAPLNQAHRDAAYRTVADALTAIGVDLGHCHTELRFQDEVPYIIEINARPGGSAISKLIQLTTGMDILLQRIQLATGDFSMLPLRQPVGYAGLELLFSATSGDLLGQPQLTAEQFTKWHVVEQEFHVQMGAAVHTPRSNNDELGHVIVTGPSVEDVQQHLRAAVESLRVETQPRPMPMQQEVNTCATTVSLT